MNATSWLEINLPRLEKNLACFREIVSAPAPAVAGAAPPPRRPVMICGTVKADAYGLGALPVAQRLAARGVDMLAVYSPAQAEQVATLAIRQPILVLMRTDDLSRGDALYRTAATGRLHLSIHDPPQMAALAEKARLLGLCLPVHLYVDTGMSRSGLSPEAVPGLVRDLAGQRSLRLAGLYTHLASAEADEAFTNEQVQRLDAALDQARPQMPADVIIHVANTCAALRSRAYHRDMIRVGLGLYGYGADQFPPGLMPMSACCPMRPVVKWTSRVIHVQRYAKGSPVGYNSTHRLQRDSVLGLIPVGYADGYAWSLSNKAVVELPDGLPGGQSTAAPVLGRVNMDQIVIDLTDAPAARPGSTVTLLSDDPASPCALPKLARLAGSSCYELLCRLNPRLQRKYLS